MSNVTVFQPVSHGPLVHAWIKDVPVEESVWTQIKNIASVPGVERIALLPDCHVGKGACVGSSILTRDILIPSCIGVDLSCGILAAPLNINRSELSDLKQLRLSIEKVIPAGFTNHGQEGDRGAWGSPPDSVRNIWDTRLSDGYQAIIEKYPELSHRFVVNQLSSLGTGNHYFSVNINVDIPDEIWIMLHSGSRGIGNKIGTFFIKQAQVAMKRWHINLPDPELAFLPMGTDLFNDYLKCSNWAGKYAHWSRMLMFNHALQVIRETLGKSVEYDENKLVHCVHNYINQERHFGKAGFVTRKGAIDAHAGVLGVVPSAMGGTNYITRGLGNPESLMTSSHGAGRVMSRNVARKSISMEQHLAAIEGLECRMDSDVIDESPSCYKDINLIMAAQSDLTEPIVRLTEILTVKG